MPISDYLGQVLARRNDALDEEGLLDLVSKCERRSSIVVDRYEQISSLTELQEEVLERNRWKLRQYSQMRSELRDAKSNDQGRLDELANDVVRIATSRTIPAEAPHEVS